MQTNLISVHAESIAAPSATAAPEIAAISDGYFKSPVEPLSRLDLARFRVATAAIGAIALEWMKGELELHESLSVQREAKLDEYLRLLDAGEFICSTAAAEIASAVVDLERRIANVERELKGEG